jgi:hypothetical protein
MQVFDFRDLHAVRPVALRQLQHLIVARHQATVNCFLVANPHDDMRAKSPAGSIGLRARI